MVNRLSPSLTNPSNNVEHVAATAGSFGEHLNMRDQLRGGFRHILHTNQPVSIDCLQLDEHTMQAKTTCEERESKRREESQRPCLLTVNTVPATMFEGLYSTFRMPYLCETR